jgi:hypothetical protein
MAYYVLLIRTGLTCVELDVTMFVEESVLDGVRHAE